MAGSSSDQDATPLSYFKYDVFLSFRGSNRPKFIDVLYNALMDKRIETFKDDRELRPSEELEGSLVEAIERSRMSILLLCDGYPSSHWCLDELVKIMECSDNGKKRPVIPIYFEVARSDVKYQKNEFAASLARLIKTGRYTHKLKAWKLALCEVGKIYGQRIGEKTRWGTAVKNIVKEVTRRLPPLPLYIDRPSGLDSELEEAKSLLEIDSHATCFMLGIHGDGDVISKFVAELYNKIRPHFEAASFLSNVSGKTNESGGGLEDLQEKLLSEMGEEVKANIGSTFKGSSEIKQRLGHKRVLLVLDAVETVQQLTSLAGGSDWFGPGSRIIITTRDEDVLDDHVSNSGVEVKKYYVKGSSSTVMGENVVGLEKDFEEVIKQLKGEEGSAGNVVSIVGMGGLGKTTLARKVYYSNEARQLFPHRAWVTISQSPILIQVLRKLLNCLKVPVSKYENSSDEEELLLKGNVRDCLNRRKWLVVLDDVWDSDALRSCFPNNKNGSKILVTTRNDQVANAFESKKPHLTVSPMNEEESWQLFLNEVFHSALCPPELEPIGKSIAKSCNGLPLLIKTTAGTVAKRERSKEAWEKIKDLHPYWSIAEDKDGKQMMERLKLSYDDLLEKMKPCFLYLGVFAEDQEISVRELICMWMAEEFIEKPRIQTGKRKRSIEEARAAIEAEDIGEEYLNELVDRNLLQVASRRCDGKGVKTVKIHDLIRELCILVSEKPDNNCDKAFSLSFPEDIEGYACLVRPSAQSSTCSLLVHGNVERWSDYIPEDCQVCNVLYLEREKGDPFRSRNAEYLKKFKSVRFLNMKNLDVPSLLFQLQSLQSFRAISISCTKRIILHEGLNQLRHFRTSFTEYLIVGGEGVENKMKNVQTLSYVFADSEMGVLLDNGYFANVRALGLAISKVEVLLLEENLKSLDCLSKLRKLKFKFYNDTRVSFGKIKFPWNLSKISLSHLTGLKEEDMKTLGQIPTLQILKLYKLDCTEKILHCGDAKSFPLLEVFILRDVTLIDVKLEDGAMPKLRRAVFDECPGLKLNCLPKRMHYLGSNLHFVDAGDDYDYDDDDEGDDGDDERDDDDEGDDDDDDDDDEGDDGDDEGDDDDDEYYLESAFTHDDEKEV